MSTPVEREALSLLEQGIYFSRSCWNCKGSKEELEDENTEVVLWCFDCEKYYFKGIDVTETLKPDSEFVEFVEETPLQ
jgi:hypothetical protein